MSSARCGSSMLPASLSSDGGASLSLRINIFVHAIMHTTWRNLEHVLKMIEEYLSVFEELILRSADEAPRAVFSGLFDFWANNPAMAHACAARLVELGVISDKTMAELYFEQLAGSNGPEFCDLIAALEVILLRWSQKKVVTIGGGTSEKSAEDVIKTGFDLIEQHSQVSVPTWGDVAKARESSKAQELQQLRAYFLALVASSSSSSSSTNIE